MVDDGLFSNNFINCLQAEVIAAAERVLVKKNKFPSFTTLPKLILLFITLPKNHSINIGTNKAKKH